MRTTNTSRAAHVALPLREPGGTPQTLFLRGTVCGRLTRSSVRKSVATLLLAIVVPHIGHAFDPPPMPADGRVTQQWWRDQYAPWCRRHGGTPRQDGTGGRCENLKETTPPASSANSPSSSNIFFRFGEKLGEALVGGTNRPGVDHGAWKEQSDF